MIPLQSHKYRELPIAENPHPAVPLVVDVDGSLVCGDLLIEGITRLLAATPHRLFALLFWLARGRAAVKRRVAQAVPLPLATLVLNPAVLQEIAAAKAAGREVWLASAADEGVVVPLAESLEATGCLASDGHANLAGQAKAEALVEKFGEGGFDYIGNERRDLAVWKRARRAIGVGLPAGLARAVWGAGQRGPPFSPAPAAARSTGSWRCGHITGSRTRSCSCPSSRRTRPMRASI